MSAYVAAHNARADSQAAALRMVDQRRREGRENAPLTDAEHRELLRWRNRADHATKFAQTSPYDWSLA